MPETHYPKSCVCVCTYASVHVCVCVCVGVCVWGGCVCMYVHDDNFRKSVFLPVK